MTIAKNRTMIVKKISDKRFLSQQNRRFIVSFPLRKTLPRVLIGRLRGFDKKGALFNDLKMLAKLKILKDLKILAARLLTVGADNRIKNMIWINR